MAKEITPLISLGEITDNIIREISARKDGDNFRFNTDLRDIDDIIIAIRKKRLYIIGGRSSIGKTSLMCNIAFNMASKHVKVMYFSLEMSKEEIAQRFICMGQFVKYSLFELDRLADELKLGMDRFKKMIAEYKLIVIDNIGYKFSELADFIQNLFPKPDVIFIDHIQMCSVLGYRNKYEALSEYIRKLKELAVTQNVAIVVASQISRAAGEVRPKISHLKESGVQEEVADVVLLCYWPYMHGESNDINEYYVLVGKNRFGRTKSQEGVRLHFEPAMYKFKDY